jgi:hypothetical protein
MLNGTICNDRSAEGLLAEFRSTECRSAECRSTECRSTEYHVPCNIISMRATMFCLDTVFAPQSSNFSTALVWKHTE